MAPRKRKIEILDITHDKERPELVTLEVKGLPCLYEVTAKVDDLLGFSDLERDLEEHGSFFWTLDEAWLNPGPGGETVSLIFCEDDLVWETPAGQKNYGLTDVVYRELVSSGYYEKPKHDWAVMVWDV